MSNQGWVKLHRKLLDNPILSRGQHLQVWITLLLLANHKPNTIIVDNKRTTLSKGQVLTSRKVISKMTNVPETTIERILNYLENEHQIGQQKTNKYRIITILNYTTYQGMGTKTDNRWTTKGQRVDTNKNVLRMYKNVNKDKVKTFTNKKNFTYDEKTRTYKLIKPI